MRTKAIGQPRRIAPELVDIGDDIAVEHRPVRGLTTTNRGIIAKRMDHGQTRHYLTAEGGIILTWEPGRKAQVTVTLYGRADVESAALFGDGDYTAAEMAESMQQLRERIDSGNS